jgi:transposase
LEVLKRAEVKILILQKPQDLKIFMYPKFIDMRKSWNGLVSLVQMGMNLDAFEKSMFVFCGRSQKIIKIIYWDGNGFCIWMKRLEKGIFPFNPNKNLEITRSQLMQLLSGIDTRRKHKEFFFLSKKKWLVH